MLSSARSDCFVEVSSNAGLQCLESVNVIFVNYVPIPIQVEWNICRRLSEQYHALADSMRNAEFVKTFGFRLVVSAIITSLDRIIDQISSMTSAPYISSARNGVKP